MTPPDAPPPARGLPHPAVWVAAGLLAALLGWGAVRDARPVDMPAAPEPLEQITGPVPGQMKPVSEWNAEDAMAMCRAEAPGWAATHPGSPAITQDGGTWFWEGWRGPGGQGLICLITEGTVHFEPAP